MAQIEDTIHILLAAYNGEAYVEEQLFSIILQSHLKWKLYIRDDGSKDCTPSILNRFSKYDDRIHIVHGCRHVGTKKNFSILIDTVMKEDPSYLCFSDQDDLWSSNKLSLELEKLKELENIYGHQTPILIHTDLKVVDENLNITDNSFMRFHGIYHETNEPMKSLVVQNFVTGCTIMFNKALLDIAAPVSNNAVMHDWWFALCSAAFGEISFIPKTTVYYRQHSTNVLGAKSFWKQILSLRRNWKNSFFQSDLSDSLDQAMALKRRWEDRGLNRNDRKFQLLSDYLVAMFSTNLSLRVITIIKLKIKRQRLLMTIFYYISVFFFKPTKQNKQAILQ
jgi:glycosyltransferase involved in cell wall biosynthesis